MRLRHAAFTLALMVATSLPLTGHAAADSTADAAGDGRITGLDQSATPRTLVSLDPATGTVTTDHTLPPRTYNATFSADGSQLAYVRGRDECTPQPEGCMYRSDLWIADADGGNARVLVDGASESIDEVAWAPDGKRILIHTMRADQTQRLEWIATDGTGREVLNTTGGHDAAFSPDGKSLAFLTTTCWDTGEDNNCGRDLHVLHLASGKVSTLTTDHRGGEWTRPDWSADGRHIVYSTGYGLRSVDVAAGTFVDVRIPVYAWTPVFSPDGDRIAFTGQDDASTRKVYVVDATPGASTTVLSDRHLDLRDWLAQ